MRKTELRRKTPLRSKRSAATPPKPLSRKTSVNKRNAKRKRANFARAYGGKLRVEWVKAQRCLVCGWPESENAHVKTGGIGRKSDAKFCVPLCSLCHRALHEKGRAFCEGAWGFNLDVAAAVTEGRWQEHVNNQRTVEQRALKGGAE